MNASWTCLLLAVPLAPLVLASCLAIDRWRPIVIRLTPLGALPGLLTAFFAPSGLELSLEWLLLGGELALDETGRVFLLFTSWLWLIAGWFAIPYLAADQHRTRFFCFYLLAMAGNLGLILAQDLLTFNSFFTLMSLAAYGLIIHRRNAAALAAGRLYIMLAVLGEVLLFLALLLLLHSSGSLRLGSRLGVEPLRPLLIGLLLTAFGIKAGLPPLHIWLPLAHPAAPVPASAVLSGAMIKAGLLGWLRFLPLGQLALPGWSHLCLILGFLAAFLGAAAGIVSREPKTVLAYSSISQMGLMTVGLGVGLAAPDAWPAALAAIQVYAVHHGLAKGALFLGVGIAARRPASRGQRLLVAAGLLLPALSLAGAPFTSGLVAKTGLQKAATHLAEPWPQWMALLLPLSALATFLLLLRFLQLLRIATPAGSVPLRTNLWLPWMLLVLTATPATLLLPAAGPFIPAAFSPAKLVAAAGPILLAAALGLAFLRRGTSMPMKAPGWERVRRGTARGKRFALATIRKLLRPRPRVGLPLAEVSSLCRRAEEAFSSWPSAGTCCVLLILFFYLLLSGG